MSKKLIRFDWALKKLLRNKANFDILEGFLSEFLHFEVTVENILESEGNKQDEYDKYNSVDVLEADAKPYGLPAHVKPNRSDQFFS